MVVNPIPIIGKVYWPVFFIISSKDNDLMGYLLQNEDFENVFLSYETDFYILGARVEILELLGWFQRAQNIELIFKENGAYFSGNM